MGKSRSNKIERHARKNAEKGSSFARAA